MDYERSVPYFFQHHPAGSEALATLVRSSQHNNEANGHVVSPVTALADVLM